jgi:hypothetical protein
VHPEVATQHANKSGAWNPLAGGRNEIVGDVRSFVSQILPNRRFLSASLFRINGQCRGPSADDAPDIKSAWVIMEAIRFRTCNAGAQRSSQPGVGTCAFALQSLFLVLQPQHPHRTACSEVRATKA